jgi:squalene-hopene/tetraprenyl-beta-curcumene cyclase
MRIEWESVPCLPFELGCLPHGMFSVLRLHVVSYALPALIAIGQLLHERSAGVGPVRRSLRCFAVRPTLRRLERLQPASGGFLEATPLTSFVVMSLAGAGRARHPVCRKGVDFLRASQRGDGSWPIDTNLSNWLTSLSVEALAGGGLQGAELDATRSWLLCQQHTRLHPYTSSPPGGWAWTDLSGGVPDADDTAGALVALAYLGGTNARAAARRGVEWLLGLQNSDGGWPTFCRGWGRLPFDRSAPDLTAHALRALNSWPGMVSDDRANAAILAGFNYLSTSQRSDGSWVPLWFGNQQAADQKNPVYGTARVLAAFRETGQRDAAPARRARRFLLKAQNPDGSWGGGPELNGTMEETALATGALAVTGWTPAERRASLDGARYLACRIEEGGLDDPAPIGLYFAKLWYAEQLYPTIWTTAALGRVLRALEN